ncbi:MerR family transcriptional regulator, partial [Nonomuraea sp. bgisy094]
SSGYRRYTAEHAIKLVKIRTLANAGLPLARIKDLLDADPDTLTAAIAEVDHDLQDRIAQLRRVRDQLAQLRGGDRLFVSPEVADHLEDLRQLGVSERQIHLERDGWILMQTASPEDADLWIAEKRELLTNPEFRALYLEHDAAYDWPANDPRLPALADRTRNWFTNHHSRSETRPVANPAIARLAAQSQPGASSPAWDRLAQLMNG